MACSRSERHPMTDATLSNRKPPAAIPTPSAGLVAGTGALVGLAARATSWRTTGHLTLGTMFFGLSTIWEPAIEPVLPGMVR